MGILRADLLTHSQLSNTSGSVEFDGTTDFIQIPSSRAWRVGDANLAHKSVTIEWWIYLNTTSGYHNAFDINYTSGLVIEGANGVYSVYGGGQTLINEGILDAAVANRWYHYALVIHGGPASTPKSIFLYRDGKLSGAGKIDSNVGLGSNSNNLSIGARQSNGANSLNGYISNFRWSDEVVYNSEFTVPKFNLKARPSTLLLCCQSSTSATEAVVSVAGGITANGNATHSSFNPGLKDDITDTGVVFDGFGSFATSTYMVPPSGKTTERNRGRGVFAAGETPSKVNTIEYINIQSMGTAKDFGDLTTTAGNVKGLGSSTRGVFRVDNNPTSRNVLEFITFATTSNATDFGDLVVAVQSRPGASNQTRGIFSGGLFPGSSVHDTMDYITIATAGNAADFGDLTVARGDAESLASPTRMVVAGGWTPGPTYSDVVDYVTIATTGNAADFGDLNTGKRSLTAVASSTRGVFGPGKAPSVTNVIDFVTIASTGNATDFGDALVARGGARSASNSIRGLFSGGYTPSLINGIEFITIASTGNGADFGDMTFVSQYGGGCSDSHGGLS